MARVTTGPDPSARVRVWAPILNASLSLIVIFIAVLAIPLGTAVELGLSQQQTAGWIMAVYGVAGALAVILSWRYRQPLLLTGNVFILIFIARLGAQITWAELVGGAVLAGGIVLVLGPLGLTKKLVAWLPGPVVFGLLSGAVLPFFVDMFTEAGDAPLLVAGTIVAFLVARVLLEPRIPALLLALLTAFLIALASGDLSGLRAMDLAFTSPVLTLPSFSWGSVLTVTPVMVVLITVQANIPSMVFLDEQRYQPPEAAIGAVSGLGTIAASLLGPAGISLSLPATALTAGEEAGAHASRYLIACIVGFAAVALALLSGFVVPFALALPDVLLVVGVGVAVLGILSTALQKMTAGPLTWGPLFAFAIALSDLTIAGLGPFFWAIVGGSLVSFFVERDAWRRLHGEQPPEDVAAAESDRR